MITRDIDLLESQQRQKRKEDLSEKIFSDFLGLIPSNYTSQVIGPFYTIQFKAFADFLAELQVSAETLSSQVIFNYTDPDFLQNVLGLLILPDGQILDIDNLADYKSFLVKFVGYLLQGSRQAPIQEAIASLSDDVTISIVDRLTSNLEDSFFIDVLVSKKSGKDFPTDLFKLRDNIDIILEVLKPAHLLHEYQNLFTEEDSVPLPKDAMLGDISLNLSFSYYQEMRKNFTGAAYLSGTPALLQGDTLVDGSADFSRVRPGAVLTLFISGTATQISGNSLIDTSNTFYGVLPGDVLTVGSEEYRIVKVQGSLIETATNILNSSNTSYQIKLKNFIVREVSQKTLKITTWFPSYHPGCTYQVTLDEVGQVKPRKVTEEELLVDSTGRAYTSFGPLVWSNGSEKLAGIQDVLVTGGSLKAIDPYSGVLYLNPGYNPKIKVTYYWYPNPRLVSGGLNTGGAVLNKWGSSKGSGSYLNRFEMRQALNVIDYPQPLIYSPRYWGILSSDSTVLNNYKILMSREDLLNMGADLNTPETSLNNYTKITGLLNSTSNILNRVNAQTSGEYYYGKTFKTAVFTSSLGVIDLKSGGIFVDSIKEIKLNTSIFTAYTFNKSEQKVYISNKAPQTFTISYIPGLPSTHAYLKGQSLLESETLLYGGSLPFIDTDKFSRIERLDVDNSSDSSIDNTLLQFFSDGVLASDGFVGIDLNADSGYAEEGLNNEGILKKETSYPPLYLWVAPDAAGDMSIEKPAFNSQPQSHLIPVAQTYIWGAPDKINVLTRMTEPSLPQVIIDIEGISGNYVVS
jgi:hypothetical protein